MGIKEDYLKAVELAKAGKLEQAQALLTTVDHPKAVALLEKVNKAIAARGTSGKAIAKPKKKHNPMTVVGLIVALIALLALGVYYYQAVHLPAIAQANAMNDIFDRQQHALILETAFITETEIEIDTIQIGEADDGTVDIYVSYFWMSNSWTSNESYDYGNIMGIVGATVMSRDWQYDEIVAFPTSHNGNVYEVMVVKISDVIDYLDHEMSVEELIGKMQRGDPD